MEKDSKLVEIMFFVAIIAVAVFLGGYFAYKKINEKMFVSKAKDLYTLVEESGKTNISFDSKSNNILDSELSYFITVDEDGKITYFLAYNKKHCIEIQGKDIKKEDIEINDYNYVGLSDKNTAESVKYKHKMFSDKSKSGVSAYNNIIVENPTNNTVVPTIPEVIDTPSIKTPSTSTDSGKSNSKDKKPSKSNSGSSSTTNKPSTSDSTTTTQSTTDTPSTTNPPTTVTPSNPSTTPPTPEVAPSTPTTSTTTTTTKEELTYEIKKNYNCTSTKKGHTEGYIDDKYVYTISMGQVPSTCYSVNVTSVEIDSSSNVIINAKETYPSVNSNCTYVLTKPCVSVIFNRKPNSITVTEEGVKGFGTTTNNGTLTEKNKGTLTYTINTNKKCEKTNERNYTITNKEDSYTVTINRGRVPMSGYTVEFKEIIISSDNQVTLNAKTISPEKETHVAQVISYPCASITFNDVPTRLTVYLDDSKLKEKN